MAYIWKVYIKYNITCSHNITIILYVITTCYIVLYSTQWKSICIVRHFIRITVSSEGLTPFTCLKPRRGDNRSSSQSFDPYINHLPLIPRVPIPCNYKTFAASSWLCSISALHSPSPVSNLTRTSPPSAFAPQTSGRRGKQEKENNDGKTTMVSRKRWN